MKPSHQCPNCRSLLKTDALDEDNTFICPDCAYAGHIDETLDNLN